MAAAQNYIQSGLRNPGLALVPIAFNLGISLRTPHRAFEESDLSVAELVRVPRLAAARNDILAGSTINSVARRWQFQRPKPLLPVVQPPIWRRTARNHHPHS
jgi:AraC family transcriptional activator of tynA and feaB